ncbi:MAG TPA: AAA family ATPase, partial [Polyangiaceae bacterium]|nr:AAA family ATPase [Polyangiaceae bacterium]
MAFRALFGRSRELADLEAALDRAITFHGSIFLLSGEPGIGKSRLAEELADSAQRRGAAVFWGRAWEVEGAPSCWPWVQVLSACVQTEQGAAFMESNPLARELGRLLPLPRGQATPGSQDPEFESLRLGSAIVALLQHLSSERPLMLVFDDLHASDLATLNLLEVVARELRDLRVLVLGAYREVEARRVPKKSALLVRLGREGILRPLGRLDERAVTEWVAGALETEPTPALASAVFTATEGNPLFVDALLQLLVSRGQIALPVGEGPLSLEAGLVLPDTIRETARELLARLSPDTRYVLDAAAVLGRECPLTVLQLVCNKSVDDVLAAVGEGAAAGVLGAQVLPSSPVRFAHVLIREVLYHELSGAQRIEFHARAARALVRLHGADR